jgi:hypothetical protein
VALADVVDLQARMQALQRGAKGRLALLLALETHAAERDQHAGPAARLSSPT